MDTNKPEDYIRFINIERSISVTLRNLNQAFFKCGYIDEIDELVTTNGAILSHPFAALMALSGKPSSAMQKLSLSKPQNQTKRLVNAVNKPVIYADSSKEEHLVVLCGQLRTWPAKNPFESNTSFHFISWNLTCCSLPTGLGYISL